MVRALVFLFSISFFCCSLLSQIEEDYIVHTFKVHKDQVRCVGFSLDGKYLASGGDDKALFIHSLSDFKPAYEHLENYFQIKALEFVQGNNLFVSAGTDIKLVNIENQSQHVYKGNSTHIWSLDFAPERNKLTAGSYDRKIKVWDVSSEKVELILEGHEKSTLPVAFSPDEKYIVSGSRDETVKVWNAQTGELMKSLERHSDNIYAVAFHPTGKYFVSASLDKTIRLWDIETGNVVKTYAGHQKGISDIEFTPDGEHLLSASFDGTIQIWQTRTGDKVYSFVDHEGAVNCIDINPEGTFLASGGADGKVILWKLSKRIFAENMYYDEFQQELEGSSLLKPKRKGESKQDYLNRQERAKKFVDEVSDRYYEKYMIELKQKNFITE